MQKEVPILFSTPMVLAILEGEKTMTRRTRGLLPYNEEPDNWGIHHDKQAYLDLLSKCPYGKPGDLLWVRETWQHWLNDKGEPSGNYLYKASDNGENGIGWKPSIHLPKAASRIWLEATDVRVERLQDISRGDAMAEGCPFPNMAQGPNPCEWFSGLWEKINGAGSWEANPWVWVISFDVISTTGKP